METGADATVLSAGSATCDPFAPGFDAGLVSKDVLETLILDQLDGFGLVGEREEGSGEVVVSRAALIRFLRELRDMYNDTLDFHNFHHAFTVFAVSAKVVHAILDAAASEGEDRHDGIRPKPPLRPVHVLAILLAALCHDVDHPGHSNAFLNSTRTSNDASDAGVSIRPHPLATRHGDKTASVIEAHHVEVTNELLGVRPREFGEKEKATTSGDVPLTGGLLSSLNKADADYTVKLVEHAIMGTDLAVHRSLVQKLQLLGECLDSANVLGFDQKNGERMHSVIDQKPLEERIEAAVGEDFYFVVTQAILHAADLSNPTLNFDTCAAWSLRLSEEFKSNQMREENWRQCKDIETTAGGSRRPITDVRGNHVPNLTEKLLPLAKGEKGFVEGVMLPYWTALAKVFPALECHVTRVKETVDTYAAIAKQSE